MIEWALILTERDIQGLGSGLVHVQCHVVSGGLSTLYMPSLHRESTVLYDRACSFSLMMADIHLKKKIFRPLTRYGTDQLHILCDT